jgi:hypothetical protein
MPEVILPGTYIEVRAEGLISAGRVSTGNIGIVGTAAKGPIDEVTLISSLSEAKVIFGESDAWKADSLTLIRALDLIYKNGGQTVYAVRTAQPDQAKSAKYTLKKGNSQILELEALTPGTWGNQLTVTLTVDDTKTPKGTLEITAGVAQEVYGFDAATPLHDAIARQSVLVKPSRLFTSNAEEFPDAIAFDAEKPDSNKFAGGTDGAMATGDDYERSLALLENETVNIVVLAGQGITGDDTEMATLLQGHLKTTAGIKRERIGVIGSGFVEGKDDLDDIADHALNNDRLIYVAPGVKVTESGTQVELPGSYTAAAVAGLLSSLSVHVSPTNKVLAIEGLTSEFNSAKLGKLVQSRVLAIEKRNGFRVVKGVTTNDGAWQQITTRRIVDYAIYGVRSGCDPYIGKLNNERVRGAMKATLDGFLTRMVENEALVSYSLEVSATRAQEIAGEAMVTMTLMPTFSIDFIKVTMYLV